MQTIVYDGSLSGYLCALSHGLSRQQEIEDIITDAHAEGFLLGDFFHVHSSADHADALQSNARAISGDIYNNLVYAWLAETPGCEMVGFRYLCAAAAYGRGTSGRLDDPAVLAMTKLVLKVGGERHRMMGLLRFSEISDGTYYAPFEPDHNITALLAGHFAARIPDRNWIIHDLTRGIAALFRADENRYELVSADASSGIEYTQEELRFRELWRHFHRTIAIPERTNPGLQKKLMPSRYWKHLTEKNGSFKTEPPREAHHSGRSALS
jgi:probable DNA metabolism protein